ncbi:hypothetical protein A2630_03240 [Candidatus Woesebacteria bacterium RIFCSPHIGHO2_01_FULL_44_10]|uniref:HIT domain-containing protein n=1 Tax=Candidatus Woesebacteria bacterium RIFCSPLOWO2_01_FULL_44_14 TaxID=1802525 RepID=A0A1F8BXN8_9BACT|nr:MAG: hypothetical protein A2630_03240 [Candidatus Woesebacteria bacterium RIFCSPHIGHO2_01_FULL_44_10]OGM56425.1 MAG: hypothetical protein A3F62_01900 [Candidatus Woesebacteria bacterium RIFCSPHIGHO2_12_FULL_44_11]OGM68826.1 MAG: hypothetical protein A2975_00445 [Candidatus Woesebacteria bacterium RIFCSPLOWO2_01_FULL_44_14]
MKNCVFCQISRNQIKDPYRIIYSDKKYLAMLVLHPQTRGHFIVFPKSHFSNIKELENKEQFFRLVIKLAEEKTKRMRAPAYVLKLNNNVYLLDKDTMHVGHIHAHVIPMYSKEDLKRKPKQIPKKELSNIKKALISR